MTSKTLGILGGMSTESTISYYQAINRAVNQRLGGNHGAKLLIANLDFAEIVDLQKSGDWHSAGTLLADYAKRLQGAGADGILVATNTMHKVAPHVQSAIDVPLLHLLEATATNIQQQGFGKVGLLGTIFTMCDGFYQDFMAKHSIEIIVPNKKQRENVHSIIYDELCVGKIDPQSQQTYLKIIQNLHEAGAEAVILGCTEVGLLVKQTDTNVALIDSTQLHIDYAVNWLLNE
ncbi:MULTISPECIES: aspartate/glutamate racemase family protein [unclassified Acinetobacter]|uniref:aspartate/glutamate racemase family protein n=1 Tax=unclassified Acinetobacter TaxID=196816 RepID=UPI0035B9DE3B